MNLRSLFALIVSAIIFGISRSYLEPIISFGMSNISNSTVLIILPLLPAALVYVVLKNLWVDEQDAMVYNSMRGRR